MKIQLKHRTKLSQTGFTMVELMIASTVFTVILLVITAGVISFSQSYYRGVNSSTTQNTARSAIDNISQAIQFAGQGAGQAPTPVPSSAPAPGNQAFCAGGKQFVYKLGVQISPTSPGLYVTNQTDPSCTAPAVLSGGQELLASGMRLTWFQVTKVSPTLPVYNVSLSVAFGDPDLLCDSAVAGLTKGSCKSTASSALYISSDAIYDSAGDKIKCRLQTGNQFCASMSLSTVVQQRAQN